MALIINIRLKNMQNTNLQPTKIHEYKFWNARRLVFIQCSVTGTPLSWYVRLNDIYKQDWSAFVQAFKKQFFLK